MLILDQRWLGNLYRQMNLKFDDDRTPFGFYDIIIYFGTVIYQILQFI